MVKTFVEYQGDLICKALHSPSGSCLETDAPVDINGKGSKFSPTDLVAVALATCIATTIGIVAERKGWDVKGMRLEADKFMSEEGPRRIYSLPVVVWMPKRLSPEAMIMLENSAATCPVHRSLHPDIEAPIVFNWPE